MQLSVVLMPAGCTFTPTDVPLHTSATLLFDRDRSAFFECGFDRAAVQYLEVRLRPSFSRLIAFLVQMRLMHDTACLGLAVCGLSPAFWQCTELRCAQIQSSCQRVVVQPEHETGGAGCGHQWHCPGGGLCNPQE